MSTTMQVGTTVRLKQPVPVTEGVEIPRGTKGRIVHVCDGCAVVELDKHYPHLGNHLTYMPGITDEIVLEKAARLPYITLPSLRSVGYAAAALALFLCPGGALLNFGLNAVIANDQPAFIEKDIHFMSDHIRPGEALVAEVTGRYTRACVWIWSRDWRNTDTGVIMATTSAPGTATTISDDFLTYKFKLDVPKGLPPGHYVYRAIAHGTCPHGTDATVNQKPLPFTVEG